MEIDCDLSDISDCFAKLSVDISSDNELRGNSEPSYFDSLPNEMLMYIASFNQNIEFDLVKEDKYYYLEFEYFGSVIRFPVLRIFQEAGATYIKKSQYQFIKSGTNDQLLEFANKINSNESGSMLLTFPSVRINHDCQYIHFQTGMTKYKVKSDVVVRTSLYKALKMLYDLKTTLPIEKETHLTKFRKRHNNHTKKPMDFTGWCLDD